MKPNSTFDPVSVLKIYKSTNNNSYGCYYIEKHDVRIVRGDYVVGQGRPLTSTMAKRLFSAHKKNNEVTLFKNKLFDPNLLYFENNQSGRTIIWYRSAMKRNILFHKSLDIPNGPAWIPALLYFVRDGDIEIYAIKSNDRPNKNTKLYYAPFMNMTGYGVCFGSVRTRRSYGKAIDEEMLLWENLFFNSEFTHTYHDVVIGNLSEIWKAQSSGKNKFPNKALKPTNRTLETLISRL